MLLTRISSPTPGTCSYCALCNWCGDHISSIYEDVRQTVAPEQYRTVLARQCLLLPHERKANPDLARIRPSTAWTMTTPCSHPHCDADRRTAGQPSPHTHEPAEAAAPPVRSHRSATEPIAATARSRSTMAGTPSSIPLAAPKITKGSRDNLILCPAQPRARRPPLGLRARPIAALFMRSPSYR